MNPTTQTEPAWQGRTPLAEVTLEGQEAEGRMVLYDSPLGMYISVRIGGRGLHHGAIYRLGRENEGEREIFSWFPPLYEREGEATGQILTGKVSPTDLWGSRFLLLERTEVALSGSL